MVRLASPTAAVLLAPRSRGVLSLLALYVATLVCGQVAASLQRQGLAGTAAAATARERAVGDRLQEQALVTGTLGTIGGAGLLLVGSLVLRSALRRVSRLAEAAHPLAAGPDAAIPYGGRRDDVGTVA